MRKTLTMVVAVAALSLPMTAQAALPYQHATGEDGHDFAFTGSSESAVTIEYKRKKGKFVGTLSSDFEDTEKVLESEADEAAVCVQDREVSVYRFRKKKSDNLIGTATAGVDGKWTLNKSRDQGRYYARVGKSNTLLREYYGGIDYFVACNADGSGKIRL